MWSSSMLDMMLVPGPLAKQRLHFCFTVDNNNGLNYRCSVGCVLTQDKGNEAYRIMRVKCVTFVFVEWRAILETILHSQAVLASSWLIYHALKSNAWNPMFWFLQQVDCKCRKCIAKSEPFERHWERHYRQVRIRKPPPPCKHCDWM